MRIVSAIITVASIVAVSGNTISTVGNTVYKCTTSNVCAKNEAGNRRIWLDLDSSDPSLPAANTFTATASFNTSDGMQWTATDESISVEISESITLKFLWSCECADVAPTFQPAVELSMSDLTVAGCGDWYGGPSMKSTNGMGVYSFHPENMLNGWTNGGYGSGWAGHDCGSDPNCRDKLWFAMDLGESKMIESVKIWPQLRSDIYRSSEYEILISDTAPGGLASATYQGPNFLEASAGFTRVVLNAPWGATNQEYTHDINQAGRYVMFHATEYNSNSRGNYFDSGRSAGVDYLKIIAGSPAE